MNNTCWYNNYTKYVKFKEKRIKTNLLDNSKPITISLPLDSINIKTQSQTFSSKFIHNIDAINVYLLVILII